MKHYIINKILLPYNPILLHAVAYIDIKNIIGLLDDMEADVNSRNINWTTPLHYAV